MTTPLRSRRRPPVLVGDLGRWCVAGGRRHRDAISKLLWTEYHRHVTELSLDILVRQGTVWDGPKPASVDGPDDHADPHTPSSWIGTFLNARSGTIYAGIV